MVRYDMPGGSPAVRAAHADFAIANLARAVAWATSGRAVPLEVRLARAPPQSVADHVRILGVEPQFGARHDLLVYRAEHMALPLRSANPPVLADLERHVAQVLTDVAPGHSLVARIRSIVTPRLADGPPTAAAVARETGSSLRSLARKLAALGTSYRDVLDEVRAEQARLLLDEGCTTAEVATRLGFTEPRAFRRAFRRWFGASVADVRLREPT